MGIWSQADSHRGSRNPWNRYTVADHPVAIRKCSNIWVGTATSIEVTGWWQVGARVQELDYSFHLKSISE